MRRRRPDESDSLELLLDTICNTFGGVLFVALLIIILVRMSNNSSTASSQRTGTTDTTDDVQARIELRVAELTSLQSALREHQANVSHLESDEAIERARRVIRLRRDVEKLAVRRAGQVAKASAAVEAKNKRQQEAARIAAEVAQLKAEESRLKGQLLHERQIRSRTARMPVLHSTSKAELPAILRFGRLYFPYKSIDELQTRTLNLDDFLILGDAGSVVRVTPKPFAGIAITADQNSGQLLTTKLAPLDNSSTYLALAVWEDSFGRFAIVRDALVRLGIEYRLVPVANDGIVQEADIQESLVQ